MTILECIRGVFRTDYLSFIPPYIQQSIKFSLIVTIFANLAHLAYCILLPSLYIKLSVAINFVSIIISFISSLYILISGQVPWYYAIFPVILFFSSIFYYRRIKKIIPFATALIRESSRILIHNISIVFIEICSGALTLVLWLLFVVVSYLIINSDIEHSTAFVFYLLASFSWITNTLSYIGYTTITGIVGNETFDDANIISPLKAFFYSITYNLGSNALSAAIRTVLFITDFVVDIKSEKNDKKESLLVKVLKFVIDILRKLHEYFARYALIYVGVYSIPYIQACKKWGKKGFGERIRMSNYFEVVSSALRHNYTLVIAATCIAVYFAYYGKGSELYTRLGCVLTLMTIFQFLFSSITAITDTLILCYFDHPSLLRNKHPEVAKAIRGVSL
ncbi:XYPPX repeat family protein [Histomonas meleagridis]|uniref:XYPPX repeat family protein n=1 Tax=Histomonas meleagridis TaxID=135588 RepID=UPI00355943FC|nr:XYPPX repeat family protein [Histomonas meleagridis]KAH0797126.1 XYPPX repeat family protein [Histomonas meleagridis]